MLALLTRAASSGRDVAVGETCTLRGDAGHRPCAERSRLPFYRWDTRRHAFARLLSATEDTAGCEGVVHDATSFAHVWDLTCGFIWNTAVFHSVVDCVVPEIGFWRSYARWARHDDLAASALLFIPAEQERWARLLLTVGGKLPTAATVGSWSAGHNGTCIRIGDASVVHYFGRTTRAWAAQLALASPSQGEEMKRTIMTPPEMVANAAIFREWSLAAALQQQPAADTAPPTPTLLLIHRTETRSLSPASEAALDRALAAAHPQLARSVFHGSESLTETIRIFASATVVIAFHGAGLSNTLFCPPGTLVEEVTLWGSLGEQECPAAVDWDCGQAFGIISVDAGECRPSCRAMAEWRTPLWRTNVEMQRLNPGLHWFTYALPLGRESLSGWTEELEALAADPARRTDLDEALQRLVQLDWNNKIILSQQTADALVQSLYERLEDAAELPPYTLTPDVDCLMGSDLVSAWPGPGGDNATEASVSACGALCSSDPLCCGYTWFPKPSHIHSRCYTKACARGFGARGVSVATPGCARFEGRYWYQRRVVPA